MELEIFFRNTGTRMECETKIWRMWKYTGTKKYLKPNKTK